MLLLLIILCGLSSIVYGVYTVKSLMAADAGSERMQEISGAVAEGAQAYLRRQYTTIAGVGVVVFIVLGPVARLDSGLRLRHRRDPVGRGRLHRHERVGARQRPHRAGRDEVAGRRPRHRLPLGRGHRHAGRGPRAARRRRLLRLPDGRPRLCVLRPHGRRRPGRARLRRLADLDLRPSRRRHLHQGRRRRRRPRRQGRGRHSRGRSAQSGDHRRQRRRQRRRLRRHGGGPVRDLRGDGRRHDGARLDLLRGHERALLDHDLSADDLRRLHRDLDRRHLFRQARRRQHHLLRQVLRQNSNRQFDHGRALQGPDRHRRPVDRRPRHRDDDRRRLGRNRRRRRQERLRREPVRLRPRRPRRHRPHRRDHRVLHRHGQAPGRLDRPGLGHRPRHQRDPGPRGFARIDRAAGARDRGGHRLDLPARAACSARRSRSPPCSASPA